MPHGFVSTWIERALLVWKDKLGLFAALLYLCYMCQAVDDDVSHLGFLYLRIIFFFLFYFFFIYIFYFIFIFYLFFFFFFFFFFDVHPVMKLVGGAKIL